MDKKSSNYSLIRELIDFAKEVGQVIDDIAFTPYGRLRIHNIPRSTYYDRIEKFKKSGLIKKPKKPNGSAYVLTKKAKNLSRKAAQKINRADGLSSIVIFDIPESKQSARKALRRYLQKNGYTMIQKSVFIGPFKIFKELIGFVEELGIEGNVSYISGKIDRF